MWFTEAEIYISPVENKTTIPDLSLLKSELSWWEEVFDTKPCNENDITSYCPQEALWLPETFEEVYSLFLNGWYEVDKTAFEYIYDQYISQILALLEEKNISDFGAGDIAEIIDFAQNPTEENREIVINMYPIISEDLEEVFPIWGKKDTDFYPPEYDQ